MLYRLLKSMFWIKMNVSKQRLFKILEIKNGSEYIKEIIEHLWRRFKNDSELIELLSIKAIKTKLNCLFQRKPVKPKWNWGRIIDENHFINYCHKTSEWRRRWNVIMKWKFANKAKEVARLINESIDDLAMEYLG